MPSAIQKAVVRYIHPKTKLIRDAVAAGADVKDLNIAGEIKGTGRLKFCFSRSTFIYKTDKILTTS